MRNVFAEPASGMAYLIPLMSSARYAVSSFTSLQQAHHAACCEWLRQALTMTTLRIL